MNIKILASCCLAMVAGTTLSQSIPKGSRIEEFREEQLRKIEQFNEVKTNEMTAFRDSINKAYATFLEQKWESFNLYRDECGFLPMPDGIERRPYVIYLCSPNNPTGAVYRRDALKKWIDFANETGSLIIFDSAYEAFISGDYPHSVYEIEGAKTCAVEICSFSKTAGFTGTRCAWSVFPDELTVGENKLSFLWSRRQATKFNGVPYVVQRAAEAALSEEGQKQCRESIAYYMENARIIAEVLKEKGIYFTGGENSPYLWLECPDGRTSWEFFDFLLEKGQIVGTPGAGFGDAGEGYFRLTSFGSRESTLKAAQRLKKLL